MESFEVDRLSNFKTRIQFVVLVFRFIYIGMFGWNVCFCMLEFVNWKYIRLLPQNAETGPKQINKKQGNFAISEETKVLTCTLHAF